MSKGVAAVQAAFVVTLRGGKVLLCRRQGTGWLDGHYDVSSGHLEPGETAIKAGKRELKEEAGIEVAEKDLELFHICHNDMTPGKPYLFYFLRATNWQGEPKIMEPDKCDDQAFFNLDKLPAKTLPYVAEALKNLNSKVVTFSHFGSEDLAKLRQ